MKRQFLVALLGAVLCVTDSFGALAVSGKGNLPSCTGGTDGFINFTVSGGIPPYFVCADNLSTGISTCVGGASGLIQGLPVGIYKLTVTDAIGVTASQDNVDILDPNLNPLTVSVTTTPSCSNGGATIEAVVTNFSPPSFSFSLTGPGIAYLNQSSESGTITFPNDDFPDILREGTYQLRVQDNLNCATQTFEVSGSEPILFTYSTTALISNTQTAQLSIDSVTGGNGKDYEFSVDGGDFSPLDISDLPFLTSDLSAGTHTLTIKSGDCISQSVNFILDRTDISFEPLVKNVSCFNGNNGEISIGDTNGTVDVYSVGTTDANGDPVLKPFDEAFTDLAAGTYIVKAFRENQSISAQQTVVLHQPTEIIVNALATVPNCPGSATGTIVARATGGDGKFAFTLNGITQLVGSPATFDNLVAGAYSLVATDNDGNGCSSRPVQIVLPDPQQMGVVFNVSPGNCKFGATLTLNSVIGGTPPYRVAIDNTITLDPVGLPADFPNLSVGTHTLAIVDANGCFSPTITFEVSPVFISFAPPTITDVTCFNGKDGQIELLQANIGGNGVGPFTYTIGTSASLFKPNPVGTAYTDLAAGVYPVTVQDANGCTSPTQEVVVSQPTEVSFTYQVDPIVFPGGTGTITVNPPQGGTPPYAFSIDGINFTLSPSFIDVPTGTFDLTVRDSKLCTSKGQTVVMQDQQQMGIGFTTTAETCAGCDGSIKVTQVLDGVPPFTLIVDGVPVKTDVPLDQLSATDLCGGPHTLQVQDSVCVSPTVTAFVDQPGPLLLSYQVTEVTKNAGNDGKIRIDNVRGLGKGPFKFAIDGINFTDVGEFIDLIAGVYEVSIGIVKDGFICTLATVEIEVTEPTRSRIVGIKSIPATTNLFDGSLEVLTETTAPLQFRISGVSPEVGFGPFQDSPLFTGLTTGTYFIDAQPKVNLPLLGVGLRTPKPIVTAGQGNGAVGIAAIGEVPPITATTVVTPVDCNTGLGGSITIFATGGTAPFTFSLNGGAFQASNIFTNVPAGNNLVTIQDANGHTTSLVVTVPTVRKPTGNALFDYLAQNYCPATC